MNVKLGKLFKQTGIALVAGFVAVSAHAQNKLEPLSLRLDWTPWGVHAPFHLAKDKGWYEDAGLDVSIEDGNGSVTTVQIVGSSDNFDVGHAGLASMVIARDKGLPVKAVAPFLRKSDIGVIVPVESDIKGPADLKGKKMIYTAGSLEAPFIDHFLKKGDVNRREMDLVNVEAAGKIASYAVGRADAVVSTIPFVLAFADEQRPSRAIYFADYDLNMPSFGIFTSEKKLAEKADAISRFASVTARAWEYIYDGHQDEAVKAIMSQRPQARLNPTILRGQIDTLEQFFGDHDANQRIGVPVPSDWDEAVETLRSVDLVGEKLTGEELFAVDFVHPEKYDQMVGK